ncbi:MAG: BrnA antitoxin family protein [Deltaproteobacteria bacterium]|nr:BrnA antitoxin family protein [Deltaproteobacteria bacterium]
MTKRAAKSKRPIPIFANEDDERQFWSKNDASAFFDWEHSVQVAMPDLKPTTASISLRLPVSMLEELKALANKRDVPYQSLMKVYLSQQIMRERNKKAS